MLFKQQPLETGASTRRDDWKMLGFLSELGLIGRESGRYFPNFNLQVQRGAFIFSDLLKYASSPGFVLPVGPASLSLARMAVRKPVDSSLDMGCGNGIQSIMMAGHSRHVTATDINPRALAMTGLNAAINRLDNIEALDGSYFSPVADRSFDLVQFNPPYIISPPEHNGLSYAFSRGSSEMLRTIAEFPCHLNEGGYGSIFLNWVFTRDEQWSSPLERVLTGAGVDTLVIHFADMTALEYAEYWHRHPVGRRYSGLSRRVQVLKWAAWYRLMGMERFGFGCVVVRKRNGKNWMRMEKAARVFGDSTGDQVLSIFSNADRLVEMSPGEGIRDLFLSPVNYDLSECRRQGMKNVKPAAGILFPIRIHEITWNLLDILDGSIPVKEAISRIAENNHPDFAQLRDWIEDDLITLMKYGWLRIKVE